MQVRLTDGTVRNVEKGEGRRLIREGNAQAATEPTVAESPAHNEDDQPDDTPKSRKRP